jgi:hypothetical protein
MPITFSSVLDGDDPGGEDQRAEDYPGDDVSSGPGGDASGQDHYREDAGEDTEDQHELVALFRGEGDQSPRAVPPLWGWSVMRRG